MSKRGCQKNITIIEAITLGGCSTTLPYKAHFVIGDKANSEKVKKILRKDIIEVIQEHSCEEEKKEMLSKVEEWLEEMCFGWEVDLLNECGAKWSIINDNEFTTYYYI